MSERKSRGEKALKPFGILPYRGGFIEDIAIQWKYPISLGLGIGWETLKKILAYPEPPGYRLKITADWI
jgi:hypothetical protein